MKRQNLGIGILSLTALLLVAANIFVAPKPAAANFALKERDYQVVTAKIAIGGDGLYILDNRTGQIAVFTVVNNALNARVVRNVGDAFAVGGR
jgi:hypothetical protein